MNSVKANFWTCCYFSTKSAMFELSFRLWFMRIFSAKK